MSNRERLIEILKVPIYPKIDVDPAEVVADYLLANDFTKVVRCKDCKCCMVLQDGGVRCERFDGLMMIGPTDFCSYGELKELNKNA